MKQLFANNASTTLSVAAGSADLTLSLVSVAGFPIPAANQFFLITLSIGAQIEICSISGVNTVTNVLTVLARGQEGTTAQSFAVGTVAESRITAGTLNNFTNALDPLGSVDNLVAPVNSLANSYITGSLDYSGAPLTAISKSNSAWSFLNYSLQVSGSVNTATTTSISAAIIPNLPISYTNQYLVQLTSGVYSGYVRGISTFVSGQLTWVTPLPGAPSNSDTFEVYENSSNISNSLLAYSMYGTPITSNMTLSATDSGKIFEVSAGVVTMPTASSGLRYTLLGIGAATGSLAVPAGITLYYPDGTNTVAGTLAIGLGTAILIASNGTGWEILSTSGQVITKSATLSTQAINLGQADGRYEPLLTYTPVQQGTGVGQLTNLVKIGWSSASRIKATIDAADQGNFAMEGTNNIFSGANTFNSPVTVPTATISGQAVNLGQADARYAALAGLSTQRFAAANAVASTDVVNLGQAGGLYTPIAYSQFGGSLSAAVTLTAAQSGQKFFVNGAVAFNITLPATFSGATYEFYGINGANLVGLTGGGGGGSIYLPDGSTIALTATFNQINLAETGNAIRVWSDGGSWFMTTLGRTMVKSASLDNQAVNLGQFTTGQVKATNGSQTLPGGLILKWGLAAIATSPQTITFATAFPNACLNAVGTVNQTVSGAAYIWMQTLSASNMVVQGINTSGSVSTGNNVYWVAIGY